MPFKPESWGRIKELFDGALEEAPERRSSYLEEHCPDGELRAEVERLLTEHDQAGSFLSYPLIPNMFDAETATSPAVGSVVVRSKQPEQGLVEGEVLAGRFRIVRFIAKGGMGEVYEAEDLELHENVA